MKKYIICSFCGLMVLTGAYIFSYQKLSGISEEIPQETGQIEVAVREDTVKSTAKLIVETYNATDQSLTRKESAMPAMYLGLTRAGVLQKLSSLYGQFIHQRPGRWISQLRSYVFFSGLFDGCAKLMNPAKISTNTISN